MSSKSNKKNKANKDMTLTISEVRNLLEMAAKDLACAVQDLSVSKLKGYVSERQLKNLGGLPLLKNAYFPETSKELGQIQGIKIDKSYIADLEKRVANKELSQKQQLDLLKKIIAPVKVPKGAKIAKNKKAIERDVVVMLTDTHYGLVVDPEEIGGLNAYNWEIACRRTAFMAKQAAEYKIEKRGEVGKLHVILNGDHLHGLIHGTQDRIQELLGQQQNGAMHILTHFIGYVSQFYKEVIVHCNVGNHDEAHHRREGGRITSHAMKDSYLTPVYFGLSLAFRNVTNVKFNMSKGLFVDLELPGGRAVAVHGHILFSKQLGSTGSSINVKSLSDAINRWNQGEVSLGRKPVKLVIMGHTHCHAEFTTFDGIRVLVSPAMSGLDNYAYSLGINYNQAAQPIFESTKNYIYGDSRLINVISADQDKSLDEIIPMYKGALNFNG